MKKILAALLMAAVLLNSACSLSQDGSFASAETSQSEIQQTQRPDISALTSQEIVSSMTIGWNLGDTLDACQADRDGDGIINEHVADGEEPDEDGDCGAVSGIMGQRSKRSAYSRNMERSY